MGYCPLTKWLNFYKDDCSHCERIFERVLTLDGVRFSWAGEFVDKNHERENICKLYEGRAFFQRCFR